MRGFRVGYILTVSFLLIFTIVTLTSGFYPAPTGPKSPTYPTYPSSSTSSLDQQAYQAQQKEYDTAMKKYDSDKKSYDDRQKNFLQDEIIPYARNIFIIWIVAVAIFQAIGLLFVKSYSPLVGSAFSFSGVWVVFFGPLTGIVWFANSLVSSFGGRANQQVSVDILLQTVGITSLISVAVLVFLGLTMFGEIKKKAS